MMKMTFIKYPLLAGIFFIAACSSDAELSADDPANCEQMKEFPEMYDTCMEGLSK
jgi:hypothetical protein